MLYTSKVPRFISRSIQNQKEFYATLSRASYDSTNRSCPNVDLKKLTVAINKGKIRQFI